MGRQRKAYGPAGFQPALVCPRRVLGTGSFRSLRPVTEPPVIVSAARRSPTIFRRGASAAWLLRRTPPVACDNAPPGQIRTIGIRRPRRNHIRREARRERVSDSARARSGSFNAATCTAYRGASDGAVAARAEGPGDGTPVSRGGDAAAGVQPRTDPPGCAAAPRSCFLCRPTAPGPRTARGRPCVFPAASRWSPGNPRRRSADCVSAPRARRWRR